MTNHFHLLSRLRTPELVVGMHRLNSAHANYFNRRHDHVEHVFQSGSNRRRGAPPGVLPLHRPQPPFAPGCAGNRVTGAGSSYRATAGYVPPPEFLAADWVLTALRYVEFVADGIGEEARRAVSRGLAPRRGP
jgi:putative transposase